MKWSLCFCLHLALLLAAQYSEAFQERPRELPRNMHMGKSYQGKIGEIIVTDIQERVEEMNSPTKGKGKGKLAHPNISIKDEGRRPSSVTVPVVEREVGGERNMQDYNRNGAQSW